MAVNRIIIEEDTQTLMKSLTKQMTRRGIPNRADMRSESANEARTILVSVLSDFFLWIKKITRPLTVTVSRHMKAKRTINGDGRNVSSPSASVSLHEPFLPKQLALHVLSDAISSVV